MTGDQGGLFSALDLDLADGARPGYRLDRLEVYNWGTFDGRVYRLDLSGETTLLTGDIGSGKSTLVDAMTTLLLPAQRINYNKAAGADTRERSLRSYVLGHYKAEQNETTGSRRSVGLRDHRHYSVLLAVFRNRVAGQSESVVTLAQVFWTRDSGGGQPHRFYLTSDRELSIEADFADFGHDLGALRRRLREGGVQISDTFPDYGLRLRRLLGIHSDQALELLHQTISMKSVGNLTEFVRQHMLEGAAVGGRIDTLLRHFDDLTQAHQAVREAREQISALDPLVAHCDTHDQLRLKIAADSLVREALPSWVAGHRVRLLDLVLAGERSGLDAVRDERTRLRARVEELAETHRRLERERDGVGGDRLAELERTIDRTGQERDERRKRAGALAERLATAGLSSVSDAASFASIRARALELGGVLDTEQSRLENERTELLVEGHRLRSEGEEIGREIRSLQHRQSSIDTRSLRIREALATGIEVPESSLPFVGELVQVGAEHQDWRGAAERVLRGFALSVLVPAEHYEAATAWIDAHHLGGRLVYYRVPARFVREDLPLSGERVLADLLEVRPGPHRDWLLTELRLRRANQVCVDSAAELRQQRGRAVTRAGQVKDQNRHEKDDRFTVDDRTRWVLGWSNADKIDALVARGGVCQARQNDVDGHLRAVTRPLDTVTSRRLALAQVEVYTTFADVDWQSSAAAVTALTSEKAEIEQGNEQLAQLTARLQATATQLGQDREREGNLTERIGALKGALEGLTERRNQAAASLTALGADDTERYQPAYQALTSTLPEPVDELGCHEVEREHRDRLTARIDKGRETQATTANRAVAAMAQLRQTWPALTSELDAAMEAADAYRALRDRVAGDDLPRFEAEFKEQLNTNAIREIASFDSWLRQSAREIQSRIATINESLEAIEYNPGRSITLLYQTTPNQEVKDFRADLRACTDDALVGDDLYSEGRFLQVTRILERFRGRTGQTEQDKRWTSLVTDVRSWFVFAASERERETGREWEHYADSDGKSGGQKEKLAYTILAASLAYQFRLQWGVRYSRDFRFALIDEAFGRGSDASTRYALDLFRRLGLQLLVVTPLQKVHVIEPYVRAVGYVENRTGDRSRLRTLTIEDYHAEREAYQTAPVEGRRG
ncbi:MAG: AAA family ATPase [Actinomycetota bacterium]|nr:AAA family ATPase [Actinomycetota bacterium]